MPASWLAFIGLAEGRSRHEAPPLFEAVLAELCLDPVVAGVGPTLTPSRLRGLSRLSMIVYPRYRGRLGMGDVVVQHVALLAIKLLARVVAVRPECEHGLRELE